MIITEDFEDEFSIKIFCRHWDSNPHPSNLRLLARALPSLKDFISLIERSLGFYGYPVTMGELPEDARITSNVLNLKFDTSLSNFSKVWSYNAERRSI